MPEILTHSTRSRHGIYRLRFTFLKRLSDGSAIRASRVYSLGTRRLK